MLSFRRSVVSKSCGAAGCVLACSLLLSKLSTESKFSMSACACEGLEYLSFHKNSIKLPLVVRSRSFSDLKAPVLVSPGWVE